jgi:hypothetical protein
MDRWQHMGALTLTNEIDWLNWENNYLNYILNYARLADSMNI